MMPRPLIRMLYVCLACAVTAAALPLSLAGQAKPRAMPGPQQGEWVHYASDTRGTRYMPLLFLVHGALIRAGTDPIASGIVLMQLSVVAAAAALMIAMRRAGVPLASGTDTGPPARFQGYFEHLELELLTRAGLTPAPILAMATGGAAQCSKLTGLGFLRPGHKADFVVLTGNPLEDIRQTKTIESVWIAGRKIETR